MASYVLKTSAAVALVIGLSLGAAWLATIGTGPLGDPETFQEERPPATRVEYRLSEETARTEVRDVPTDGLVVFDELPVSFYNVSKVRVILVANTEDPAVNDQFSVRVVAPDDEERQGSLGSPQVSPSGYQISNTVIEEWGRQAVPARETYTTRSQSTALGWAAENHTDTSSIGAWTLSVDLQPPPGALRSVNVSVSLVFTVYEAFAFPRVTTEDASGAANNTTETPRSRGTLAVPAACPYCSTSTLQPTDKAPSITPSLPRSHQNPLQTDPRGARH